MGPQFLLKDSKVMNTVSLVSFGIFLLAVMVSRTISLPHKHEDHLNARTVHFKFVEDQEYTTLAPMQVLKKNLLRSFGGKKEEDTHVPGETSGKQEDSIENPVKQADSTETSIKLVDFGETSAKEEDSTVEDTRIPRESSAKEAEERSFEEIQKVYTLLREIHHTVADQKPLKRSFPNGNSWSIPKLT